MNDQQELFERYAKELQRVKGVKTADENDNDKVSIRFIPSAKGALEVTLYRWKRGADFVGLEIEGVDAGYWHTAEEKDLDYHIRLAKAALKGEVAYRRSLILRLREVCFKVDGSWHCTLTNKSDVLPYHYIKIREHI